MALATNFNTDNTVIPVAIGTEVTMGTPTLTAGVWHLAPVTDYTITPIKAPLEVAPQRTNTQTQPESGAIHNRTQQLFEVSLTMRGTAAVIDRICLTLFGDGATPNILLGSSPAQKSYVNGITNAIPVTLLFEGAGDDSTEAAPTSMVYTSCMCTGVVLAFGWGTDGGEMSVVATFTTGYTPDTTSSLVAAGSPVDMNGTPFNIKNLTATGQSLGGNDLLMYDFSLSIQRSVERLGWIDSTYAPSGYKIGMYEVTGTMNVRKDSNSASVVTNTSTGIALAVTDGTLAISALDVMVEDASIDRGGADWKIPYSYRAFFDDAAQTNPVVSIATA